MIFFANRPWFQTCNKSQEKVSFGKKKFAEDNTFFVKNYCVPCNNKNGATIKISLKK